MAVYLSTKTFHQLSIHQSTRGQFEEFTHSVEQKPVIQTPDVKFCNSAEIYYFKSFGFKY